MYREQYQLQSKRSSIIRVSRTARKMAALHKMAGDDLSRYCRRFTTPDGGINVPMPTRGHSDKSLQYNCCDTTEFIVNGLSLESINVMNDLSYCN